MLKRVHVPERLFALVIWLVSLVLARILTLGARIVADLPRPKRGLAVELFAERAVPARVGDETRSLQKHETELDERPVRARRDAMAATHAERSAHAALRDWIAARRAGALSRRRNRG